MFYEETPKQKMCNLCITLGFTISLFFEYPYNTYRSKFIFYRHACRVKNLQEKFFLAIASLEKISSLYYTRSTMKGGVYYGSQETQEGQEGKKEESY